MTKRFLVLVPAVAALFAIPSTSAQEKHQRVSPHDTVSATIGSNQVSLTYGRPYTKDPKTGEKRKIWGGVVPFEKPWRLGADEATQLTISQPIQIGGKTLPAGTYSLFMLPHSESSADLIVNKQTGEWGTKYDQSQDLFRVPMKASAAATSADQLTLAIDKNGDAGGTLKVTWEGREYAIDFKNAS